MCLYVWPTDIVRSLFYSPRRALWPMKPYRWGGYSMTLRLHFLAPSLPPHTSYLLFLSYIFSFKPTPLQRKSCRGSILQEYPLITQVQNLRSYHPLSGFIEGNVKFLFKGNNYSWFFWGHVTAVFTKDNCYAEQLLQSNNCFTPHGYGE